LGARWCHDGRNRDKQLVTQNAGPTKSHRNGRSHAGKDLDVLWRFHRSADTERLGCWIGFLGDFPDGHRKLYAWGSAELGDHLHNVCRANVGHHDGLGHIHDDIEFLNILKPDHWFHRANILPLLD
jgi:hypothetical protein